MLRFILVAMVVASPAMAGVTEIYKSLRGEHDVNVAYPVAVDRPDRIVPLSVRVTWPAGDGPFPLVVFSQGAICPKNMYAAVTDHWTSHGYVTIAPLHIDSESNGFGFPDLAGKDLVGERIADMTYILDALDDIENAAPGLSGKIDRERIAAAGHSFGGQIALAMTGLELTDATTNEPIEVADERYDVAVVLSGVGPLPNIVEGAFSRYDGPVYSSGGTKDLGATGQGPVHPWPWRMAAYFDTPPGDKYGVVLDEGDHYYGGLICRETAGGAPDFEGLSIIRGTSTAFLDAYLKDDAEAKDFLKTTDVKALTNNRATLDRK
ncbi:MAG: hypothetical protein HOH20_01330 [Rhodospirillaceae bacterium]|jgi:hypothetical protein|nr:hypothetical protein [Rhodospirillaceae bacterium]MBT5241191.1 hypothetical protein [Rhodospirillaceae bacterium]MBT5565174.1 hypothetical protein [Rhodospirillaceae bacterium]MBT6088196.1 hypothetical protein [Rhodospirillaceae bacterium]